MTLKLVDAAQLFVVCSFCENAIADGNGVLDAPVYGGACQASRDHLKSWEDYRLRELEFEMAHTERGPDGSWAAIAYTFGAYDWEVDRFRPKSKIVWTGTCFDCMTDRQYSLNGSYDIPVGDFSTWEGFMDWDNHLRGKTWLRNTDWDDVMHAIPRGTGPIRMM